MLANRKRFATFGGGYIHQQIIMEDSLKQIGQRLKGLREVLDIPAEEVAELCDITLEHYLKIENGEADPSVYRLSKISKRYGISLDVLMFGEEPRMDAYFLTRRNQGPTVERRKDYKYQSLASGFKGRKVDPFLVQVDPLPDDARFNKNSHDGQEFDVVIDGRLELTLGEKTLVLEVGDSIYFDARQPHCMRALDGKPVKFLCIAI
ncbi:cupin domain protein [Segatella baroniae F0067]|uniref:Cupin domain protein n=2 Tax=Segatella baroniae TaxID=305719 RepID=U2QFQ7_9BACT|nr:cupin domain protein [Segatella baroniae F0067]